MLKPPRVPWPYRVGAFIVALAIGLYTLQFYVFGAKFAGAVTNYTRVAAQQAADAEARAKRAAGPDFANEPGMVPVMIIPKKDKN